MSKYNLFESILREADKSRFLEPIYNRYAPLYTGIPTYESLLSFVNSNDPLMKGFDWQQLFKSFKDGNDELSQSYFDSIVNKYPYYYNNSVVKVTGLPRYDRLYNNNLNEENKIFLSLKISVQDI